MRYKKFILIPFLIILYIFLAPMIFEGGFVSAGSTSGQSLGSIQNVGVGQAVSVTVTRQYFGLFSLPVYNNVYGDLTWIHTTFFMFVAALALIFIAIEWRDKLWPER